MLKSAAPKPVSAILLFAVGILLTTTLSGALTWASLEADFYGFQRYASDERLGGLSCPALMTTHETASISVNASNPTQKVITPIIRIDTSTASIPDTIQEQLNLQPGETHPVMQTVSARNIDLGYFIFAKAYRYPAYPLPSAEATCGVMILNVPVLSGTQIFGLWLALSMLFILLGLSRWNTSLVAGQVNHKPDAAKALALVTLIGLFISSQGMWLLGLLFLALTLLLSTAMLRFITTNQ